MSRENPTKGNIRYLSLFSGIEACTVAWKPLGWEAVAFAQFEPGDNIQFPSQVLKYHYPDVPNLGDVTKITEEQIAALGHIDLVVGGSPCQSLSIAGKRHGLRHADGTLTRSGLFDYQMEIFEWAVKNNGCRFMLWENVPGAFSSNNGNDFGYILGSMVQRDVSVPKDGWDYSGVCISESGHRCVEWTVLNAAEYGVPQRRNRVFALCDSGAWWSRPPILFESEGLSRYFKESKGTQQGSSSSSGTDSQTDGCIGWNARDIRGSRVTEDQIDPLGATQYKAAPLVGYKAQAMTTGDFIGVGNDVCPTLMRRDYKDPNVVGYPEKAISMQTGHTKGNGDGINEEDVSYTLSSSNDHAVAYRLDPVSSNSMKSSNPNSGFHKEDVCCTLDTSTQNPTRGQGEMAIVDRIDPKNDFAVNVRNSKLDEKCGALQASAKHNLNSNNVVMQRSLFDD